MGWLRDFAAISLATFAGAGGLFVWPAQRTDAGVPAAILAAAPLPSLWTPRNAPLLVAETIVPQHVKLSYAAPHLMLDGSHLPDNAVAQAQLPPQIMALDPAIENSMAQAVAARLASKIPSSLTPYFDLYFYVSKAESGPWAQRLFIFRKTASGALDYEESFPVSTGRERAEQYFTVTPTGFFELDSHRFMPMARSAKWNDALMPWAMFLNYSYRTKMTGVALHAAIGKRELADIGHRASGGCVRLPIEKAKALFHRIQATMGGQVPVFTFDEVRGTTNTRGDMLKDAAGNVMVADGYRVLLFIESYPGTAPKLVAS